MMREFINTQNDLRRMKDNYDSKYSTYSAAKAQIAVSKAAMTTAEAELRTAHIYFQGAVTVTELHDAKLRISNAEAKRAQHQTLLEQAQEAVAQLESPLQVLSAEMRATERLISEQKQAMHELKESRKSQPASNLLR